MGKEKRLFLLAVITVMMNVNGYATFYPDQDKGKQEITNDILSNHKNSLTVISVKEKTYGTINENVDFTLEIKEGTASKKIVNITGDGTDGKGNTIETVNNGRLTGINNREEGKFEVISIEGGNFKNSNLISISGKNGTGIVIKEKKNSPIKPVVKNEGLVEVKNGAIGISISYGEFTNTDNADIEMDKKGIYASGKGSVGINQTGGTVNNGGLIKSENGAIGIKITNGTFNNVLKDEKGNILAVGEIKATGQYRENENSKTATPSIGMEINGAGVNVVNEGLVSVETGGIGVKVSKGTFNNKILKDKNEKIIGGTITSSGVNAFKYEENKKTKVVINSSVGVSVNGGTFNNGGLVSAETGGIGVRVSSGTFNNKIIKDKDEKVLEVGTITSSGKNTFTYKNENNKEVSVSTPSVGLLVNGESNVTNEGNIISKNEAIGVKITKGEVKNLGLIKTEGATGILISNDGKFLNDGGIIEVNQGIGIDISSSNLSDDKENIKNNGTILVHGGNQNSKPVGIKINGGAKAYNGENGIIELKDMNSTGMQVLNGTAYNKGTIKLGDKDKYAAQYSTGIKVSGTNSFAYNEGVITINGEEKITSQGMQAENSGTITNNGKEDKYSAIYVSGSASSGMSAKTSGTAVNDKYGYIEATNKGIGIKVDGAGSTGTNKGSILVTGAGSSKGMSAVSGGTITNDIDSLIQMNGLTDQGAIGIDIQSGSTGTNKGTIEVSAVKYTSAISSAGIGSQGINEETGKIIFVGDTKNTSNAMASKDGAGIFNKGTIEVSSKNSSGMFATGEGTRAENIKIDGKEETGKIFVYDSAIGMKLENNAVGVNTGTIEVIETEKKGTGVTLKNSLFVNSGTINGVNEAIKSMGGNNAVYLKNGSKVAGKIVGADGIDVLGLGKGAYDNLDVNNYEALTVRDGNAKISNSTIRLEYNKGTESYLTEANQNMNIYDNPLPENATEKEKEKIKNKEVSGNLTMADTTLAINFKDSLTNKEIENPIINIGKDGTLTFEKGMTLVFDSSDGRKKFNIYDALGLDENNGKIELGGTVDEVLGKTAVWDYYIDSNGHLTAEKESYDNVISKSQLKDFANILDEQEIGNKGLGASITALETLKTQEAFTNAVTQMSGGVHGYIVDFAALNARTMTNTMKNRALTRDYMRKRPLNSWTQDISYIDNNHRLGGLMNVDYTEKGVLGISEKQILPNGRLGLVYGGSKGNAKFDGGQSGSSTLDGAYFGGYYNHEFNNKWSLNSNANFVYTHNKVTRNVNFADINENFKSAYPTYTVGMGSSLIYTVKDDLRNKAHFYAGVDVERIMVGNINENKDIAKDETGLAIKTTSYNPRTYYSIVPSAGFMVQNTGYVFDRKYRIGADLNWETEVGDIKDGKRLQLTGLDKEYKIETSKRENVFSYSLFGALDLTESLSVNARYTSMFSDEDDADMIGAGFEYKMDTMADNFFGTLAHKLENNRPFSDRWGGTFGLIMETDDVDDYTKYDDGHPTSGDVATSMEYKPKMILSLNDKQSNWSYYFEAYHKTNNMFGSIKSDERESHASRYHGEARWNDTYSKGSYGMSFGYRNENSRKSDYYASNKTREIVKNGTHELRITPSFTYDLGHGFTLGGKSAIVFMYKYEGDRAGQMDMNTECQIGFTYTGFMPRWSIIANFYREDTWYDHSYEKITNGVNKAPKNDQVNQLRPSIIYYFGNGASFRFDARIPLGNGSWANLNDGTNGNQAYETRYGFNYYYPVTPGLTVNVGGIFLNNKTKNKDHSGGKYGNITRGYAFRPNIGFYYSF